MIRLPCPPSSGRRDGAEAPEAVGDDVGVC